jgi:hypothetical protein
MRHFFSLDNGEALFLDEYDAAFPPPTDRPLVFVAAPAMPSPTPALACARKR